MNMMCLEKQGLYAIACLIQFLGPVSETRWAGGDGT